MVLQILSSPGPFSPQYLAQSHNKAIVSASLGDTLQPKQVKTKCFCKTTSAYSASQNHPFIIQHFLPRHCHNRNQKVSPHCVHVHIWSFVPYVHTLWGEPNILCFGWNNIQKCQNTLDRHMRIFFHCSQYEEGFLLVCLFFNPMYIWKSNWFQEGEILLLKSTWFGSLT